MGWLCVIEPRSKAWVGWWTMVAIKLHWAGFPGGWGHRPLDYFVETLNPGESGRMLGRTVRAE